MDRSIVFIDMNPAIEQIPIYQLGICFLGGIAIEKGWNINVIEYHDLKKLGVEYYAKELDAAKCIAISIRNIDNTEGSCPVSYLDMVKKEVRSLTTQYSQKIVLGGAGFSILPNEIMAFFKAKYGIVGRGGEKLSELLDWLDNGKGFEEFFSQKTVMSKSMCNIYQYEKLDNIWRVMPYIKDERKKLGFDTHIGCNGNCIYCTYPSITQNQSSKRDINEICNFISMATKMGFKSLQIVDDIFNSDLIYAKEVCGGIANVSHNLQISCYLSPQIDKELVQLLKKAGITEVVMGIDSLSNMILKKMNKGFTEEEIYVARQMLKEEKINVSYTFILGSLYETIDTLKETKANILKHLPDKVTMQYGIRVYPKTPLFCNMEINEENILEPQFAVSDTVSKERIMQFIEEATKLTGERKML